MDYIHNHAASTHWLLTQQCIQLGEVAKLIDLLHAVQGQYRKAFEVKTAADAMYYNELSTTQAAYEADMKMKQTKLLAKQHTELEVLLQRASRGRDELELRRLDEADRRRNKFKKIMQVGTFKGYKTVRTALPALHMWSPGGACGEVGL